MNPTAQVKVIDSKLVLDDPDAVAVAKAVAKHNCRGTLALNAERAHHFIERAKALGLVGRVVIVALVVDDPIGGALANVLMPGADWQAIRDLGQVPIARGLVCLEGMLKVLDDLDAEEAAVLRAWSDAEPPIIVVDFGVVKVFAAAECA